MSQSTAHPPMTKPRVALRFLSGRPLDGITRTDASYLHAGTRALTPTGRASRWAMLPGWKRQVVRLGSLPALAATVAGYVAEPALMQAGTSTAATVLAARGARHVRGRLRTRRFRAVYVRPLARTVAPMAGIAEHVNPDKWLTISPDLAGLAPRLAKSMSPAELWVRAKFGEYVSPALVYVPERITRAGWWAREQVEPVTKHLQWFRKPTEAKPPRVEIRIKGYVTPEQQKLIGQVVAAKLPLGDLITSWDQIGDTATGTWTVRKRPPSTVSYEDIAPFLPLLKEHEFIVGLTADRRPVIVSLDDDAPHIACSAGSGAGKSVLAMLLAVQVLMRGGRVLILDRKGSHRWALGLPGVTYCTQPADMHAALIGTSDLADRRNTQAMTEPEGWDPGYRHFIIFEEMNATIAQLRAYWEEVRDKSDPKLSPAIQAFRNVMFMGRSAKHNLFGVAQMLTANTTGGPEARENFGIRALARYTANNWRMLAPEAPMPRKSKTRGRWQIVVAGEATETQVAFLLPHEARAIATLGNQPEDLSPVSPATTFEQGSPQTVPGTPMGAGDTPRDPFAEPMTLREAVETGIIPGTFDGVKKRLQRARKNHPEWVPSPVGKRGLADIFRTADLIEWIEIEERRKEFKTA